MDKTLAFTPFIASICQKDKKSSHSGKPDQDLWSHCCGVLSASPCQADVNSSVCGRAGHLSDHCVQHHGGTENEVHQVSSGSYIDKLTRFMNSYCIASMFHRSTSFTRKSIHLKGESFHIGSWIIPMRMGRSSMQHPIFLVLKRSSKPDLS